jgi:hypothetical protein
MMFNHTSPNRSELERGYHLLRISASQNINSIADSVLHDMAVLDSKSAALLQFISVVLAALTFGLGLVDASASYAHYIRAAILVFIACFAIAAWIDMRCLFVMSPGDFIQCGSVPDYETALLAEIAKRHQHYRRSLHLALNSFILLMPFLMIWIMLAVRASSLFA